MKDSFLISTKNTEIMYKNQYEGPQGYAPEYVDDEQYESDESMDLSEAAASEIYSFPEALAEATEGMDDDELAEFAEELMDDEFWGALISAVAPLAMKLGRKVVGAFRKRKRRRRRRRRISPRQIRAYQPRRTRRSAPMRYARR